MQPWNTKGLVESANNTNIPNSTQSANGKTLLKQTSVMKDSYDLGTINNYHKDWKSRPYNKENEPIPNSKSHAQLNKVQKNYEIFNSKNIGELNNQRTSDESSFKSEIKTNPHVDNKEYTS